jgi:hypothetical protein
MIVNRPPSGSMVYWRFQSEAPCEWKFGYVTYAKGCNLIRMGRWNGDSTGGPIVSTSEIEWKHR